MCNVKEMKITKGGNVFPLNFIPEVFASAILYEEKCLELGCVSSLINIHGLGCAQMILILALAKYALISV